MPFLLDTNVWIHYLKQSGSPIHTKLASLRPADVVTCSIVRSELLHGAEKYGDRAKGVATLNQTLAPFNSFSFFHLMMQMLSDTRPFAMNWKHLDTSSDPMTFK